MRKVHLYLALMALVLVALVAQPAAAVVKVEIIEGGESTAKFSDCPRVLVGPGVNQPCSLSRHSALFRTSSRHHGAAATAPRMSAG